VSLEKKYKNEKANSLRLKNELARTKKAKNNLNSELTTCQKEFHE
jgi:hypothetical protein